MLIQEIRAKQVLEEEGLDLPINVIHEEIPKTFIGDEEFTLIFPKSMFEYESDKIIDIIFIGKMTDTRKEFLNQFDATIIESLRGRDKTTKGFDESYFQEMSKAKFVLCPNGDFVWTYRFFEAMIFKAIPVIEDDCSLYSGYRFYRKGDKLIYREDWVKYNLDKLKNEMTWK